MSSLKAKLLLLLRFKALQRLGAEFSKYSKGISEAIFTEERNLFHFCAVHKNPSSQPPDYTSIKLIVQIIYFSLVT